MNILIVSTSDIHGGAAIAAFRLMKALQNRSEKVTMLVRDKLSDNHKVVQIGSKLQNKRNFYWERAQIFLNNRLSKENLFDVSLANTGFSITRHPLFKQADVIHLHWINQGMLSVQEIGRIVASGKKVVWTMHDMWPFTGICHHANECSHYKKVCGTCPYLVSASKNDASHRIFRQKQQAYARGNLTFVACSRWLQALAEKSPLTAGHRVVSVSNPIDTQQYIPKDKTAARKAFGLPEDKRVVLFAAVKASDKRKGIDYLIEAAKALKNANVLFLIAGAGGDEIARQLPGASVNAGYVSPYIMPDLYNAADVFVTPSLQENLPNTLMEAMACGTPCVGFDIGGIPEMIDHKTNGYVAEYKNAVDLANGLFWTLFETDTHALGKNAREKALTEYAQEKIANRYLKLYAE